MKITFKILIMLENMLQLNGVKPLSKTEQSRINGGASYRVNCIFEDGHNWSGHADNLAMYRVMAAHCRDSGGRYTVEASIAP